MTPWKPGRKRPLQGFFPPLRLQLQQARRRLLKRPVKVRRKEPALAM